MRLSFVHCNMMPMSLFKLHSLVGFVMIVTLMLLALPVNAGAQTVVTTTQPSVNFDAVAVGAATGATQTLSFTVPLGITLGSISAVTEGASNLDFTVVPGGTTCASGTTAATCVVRVQFLPMAPGTRMGALVLTDQSSNTLITVPVYGTGSGPMVAFGPGIISTVAGNGTVGYSGDGGSAVSSELAYPMGVAVDGAGNLYIADGYYNNRIRKVTPGGTITTVAGNGVAGYNGDNIAATSAELSDPSGVAVDGAGNLYIADLGNSRIRKVTPDGTITTMAGNGTAGYNGDNIAATSAEITYPEGVAVDGAGNLYIADYSYSRIRKVSAATGLITTVAGNGTSGYNGDNIPATNAELNSPMGLAVDGAGNLYIADYRNERIRKVTPGGTITTVAGDGYTASNGQGGYSGDGGPATSAELNLPYGVAVDASGNLYIVDDNNGRIRKVTPDGIITTVAGNGGYFYNGDNMPSTSATLWTPWGVAVDGAGNLFIADTSNNRIRKVDVSDAPSLTFASTNVGAASAAQDVTVLNSGNAPLNISQISTAANFSLGGSDTSCSSSSQTLAPAASCVLGIEFTPASAGSINGSVVLTDNALNAGAAIQTIALQGTGLQQSQTITFPNPGTQTYGVAPITLTATASSGLAVSYTVASGPATVSGNTLTITGAGSVTVQATQSGNTNYTAATPVGVTFTVNPAALTVVANNSSVVFGASIPTLTGTLTGVVAGDGVTASYTTTATQGSAAGTYPITPTLNDPNGKLSNYSVTKTSGTLTITATAVVTTTQSSVNFGAVAVGASAGTIQTLSFTVPSNVTLGSVSAVTQGATNLDFTVVPGGTTCASGATATTCTVQVQFLAKATGTRLGGVVLSDQSGNTLLTFPLVGTGTGPIVAFGPGTITTVAGNGMFGYNSDNIAASIAELGDSSGVAVDSAGNLYIGDAGNGRIRKVTPGGTISTVAGTGIFGYNGDNIAATTAELNAPFNVAVDGSGNLYIADTWNNRIRKVTPGGIITTVAGGGSGCSGQTDNVGDGCAATSAELYNPYGVAIDGSGNLYIADWSGGRIRKVTPDGTITTVAGGGSSGCTGQTDSFGDGCPATSVELSPMDVAVDGSGNIYIADWENGRIREVTSGGTITTVAEGLNFPHGVTVDAAGNLYIADTGSNVIRKVTPGGIFTTVAGNETGGYSGDGEPATSAQLSQPSSVAVDGSGNLYIADWANSRVRKVDVSDPPSLTFASTNVGAASASQDVTVLNLGNAPLNISQNNTSGNFTVGGPDNTCSSPSQTLAPAASCVLGIEFNPTASGSISGSVVLNDNALNAASATQTISMAGTGTSLVQQSQTISFPNPGTPTYGLSITLTATASSGLPVSYSVSSGPATVSGSTLNTTGTGSVTIQAAQSGNTNYSAATPVSVTFTVAQAPLTVSPISYSRAVGAANPAFNYTITGFVNGDSTSVVTGAASCSSTATTTSPAGSYPITCSNGTLSAQNYTFGFMPGTLYVLPGLLESNVSVSPASPITAGTVITVGDTATNNSVSPATGTVLYYFSTTSSASGSVYANRSTGLLAAGASSSGTAKVTVPSNLSGAYYVVACVTTCSSTPITIVPPPSPILAESNVSVSPASPITAGTVITVSDTVTDSVASGAGTVLYYFSTTSSASGSVYANRSTGLLAVGASSSGTAKVTVPSNLSGAYYVVACVTTCSSTPITIVPPPSPILAESNVSVSPASPITAGTVITVSDTVTDSVASGAGTVLYYFSTTSSASGSVYANRSTGLLAVGASSSGTAKVTVPSNLSGAYYVVACVTTCSSTPITIVPPPAPILAESNVSVSPASPVTAGSVITVSDTVTDSVASGAGTVLYYFSTTSSPSGAVYANRNTGLLAVGASSSGTAKVTVPSNLSGAYYVVACVTTCSSIPVTINHN